jgi:integrase
MPKITLTQALVDNLTCPPTKSKEDYFDTKTTGLLVQVLDSGRKTFYIRYQNERKKTVQKKLANASLIKLAEVRNLAIKYLAQIAMGEDPFSTKADLKKVPTVNAFITNSYLPYVKTYKRSWETDVSLIKNHIVPNFGNQYMDQVSKSDIIQFISKHSKTHKPGSVNRVIILLRYIFNLAIRWETPSIKNNPTAGIPLLEENNKKERYITADEANRLILALQRSENSMLQYIVPMLILTGARKQEVLKARWADFNVDQRLWRIPTSKSGKARHVPISDGVLLLLTSVPKLNDCEYVFPNPKTQLPYISVFCAWNTARKSVGLADVRIHDLRHSFASFLVNNGRSLYEVQKILGHTQIKTTQRYAHLANETLLDAANEVSKALPILLPEAANTVIEASLALKAA